MTTLVLLIYLLLTTSSFFIIAYKLHRNKINVISNYNFYLLFFSLFYIGLPAIFALVSHSYVGASIETIQITSLAGSYFILVFLLAFAFSDNNFHLNTHTLIYNRFITYFSISLLFIVSIYILWVIYSHFDQIISYMGDRAAQSTLNTFFNNVYKVKALFAFHLLLIIYVFSTNKNNFLIILFSSPFIILDLLLSGRIYLFGVSTAFFLLNFYFARNINFKYLIISIFLILSISFLRIEGDFQWTYLSKIFGEFNYTWQTTHLMYESNLHQDFIQSIVYALMRILPSFVYNLFFDEYISYARLAAKSNPLGWGLAGSVVAEAISFKNILLFLLFPWLMIIYSFILNFLFKNFYFIGMAIFILSVIFLQQMFRYSFLELALYPFYVVLFPGFYLFILQLSAIKSRF